MTKIICRVHFRIHFVWWRRQSGFHCIWRNCFHCFNYYAFLYTDTFWSECTCNHVSPICWPKLCKWKKITSFSKKLANSIKQDNIIPVFKKLFLVDQLETSFIIWSLVINWMFLCLLQNLLPSKWDTELHVAASSWCFP